MSDMTDNTTPDAVAKRTAYEQYRRALREAWIAAHPDTWLVKTKGE